MYNDQRSHKSMLARSGWLFADMFLATMMIFLVASTIGKYDPVKPGITPTPQIVSINPHAQDISITVNVSSLLNNDLAAQQSVRNQVKNQVHANQSFQAGMVLTFSCGLDDSEDTNISDHVNVDLHALAAFNKAVFRDFINRGCPLGEVDLEIYYFTFNTH